MTSNFWPTRVNIHGLSFNLNHFWNRYHRWEIHEIDFYELTLNPQNLYFCQLQVQLCIDLFKSSLYSICSKVSKIWTRSSKLFLKKINWNSVFCQRKDLDDISNFHILAEFKFFKSFEFRLVFETLGGFH